MKTERLYKNGLTTSKAIRMEKGIANDDIFNFDGTEFAMGLIATMKVVTRSERFIKGCKYAMNNTALLARENTNLRAENANIRLKKRSRR